MNNMITFRIDEQPLPKQRPRFGNGKAYTPAKTKAYEERVGWACAMSMREHDVNMLQGDVSIKVTFMRKGKRRADLDNMVKAIKDGINDIAYVDDKQVTSLHCEVRYGQKTPCAIVTVQGIGALSCTEVRNNCENS